MSDGPMLGRKPLRDMTPAERAKWYATQKAELEEFCTYAQAYIKRRAGGGRQNHTDARYNKFFHSAADLINGLDELQQEAVKRQTNEDQEQGE